MGFVLTKIVFKNCIFVTDVKPKKKRADRYDTKLAVNASFEDVINISAEPYTPKPEPVKPPKKK
jgi:hypothetical protein